MRRASLQGCVAARGVPHRAPPPLRTTYKLPYGAQEGEEAVQQPWLAVGRLLVGQAVAVQLWLRMAARPHRKHDSCTFGICFCYVCGVWQAPGNERDGVRSLLNVVAQSWHLCCCRKRHFTAAYGFYRSGLALQLLLHMPC